MANLTIYLLRSEVKNAASAIEGAAQEVSIKSGSKDLGTLYVRPIVEKVPAWATLFEPLIDISILGKARSVSALYITESNGRLFALAFGQGRFLLKPTAYEERFGLLVVLNSVKADELRSIDKRTFDTVDQNSRVQVSQQSSAVEFGIDIEKDLIRAITGSPEDETLGSRMTGSDALNVAVDVSIQDLKPLLGRYLAAYQSDGYKANFAWVDHISQVGDKSPIKEELDNKLIELLEKARLNGGHVKGCWLAIPDIIDYSGVHRFRFNARASVGTHNDLHLPGFMSSLRQSDDLSIDLLKARYAVAVDEDENPVSEKWSVYKCLHCEVELDTYTYLLASGRWFRIKKEFADEVDDFYKSIPRRDLGWMEYQHDSEGAYNEAIFLSDSSRYALMDKKNISVGGIYDKVEFCDIYSLEKEIIHVKRYGGSSLLGHLFNQGLVSGELLREDKGFLSKVNHELPSTHGIADLSVIPRDVGEFSIVFAIVSEERKDELNIPFFARVALKHVHKRLSSMSYPKVELAKISVNEIFSKSEKLKEKAKKSAKVKKSA